MMRIRLCRNNPIVKIITTVLAGSAFCLSGCAQESSPPAGQSGKSQLSEVKPADKSVPEGNLLAEGAALFKDLCTSCHGSRGNGRGRNPGPSLQRPELTYGRTPEAITQSIREGRPGGMPSFSHVVSPRQLEALSAYVMSLKK